MAMIIQHGIKGMVVAAQSKALKQENVLPERLHGLDQQMKGREDGSLYFLDRIWVPISRRNEEGHCYLGTRLDMSTTYHPQTVGQSERTIQTFEDMLRCAPFEALYGRKCRSPVLWAEIRESSLIGPELVQETTNKVVLIKEKLKAAKDHQKSYADNRRKPLEFEVRDKVMLEVSSWKGVIRFGKKGKLPPSEVHDTFHVSNLKKCLADANLHVPMDEINTDKTLHFVEEPVEIMDREVKTLKCSKILIVKVRWNSKRGPEFTWEREDHMKARYPQLFVANAGESSS
ncbi:putative reverse transcriptase domain-containing protein [Tanacetum coccineum]